MNDSTGRILWTVFTVLLVLVVGGLQCDARIDCAPRAGEWTPWTGKICYGEKP